MVCLKFNNSLCCAWSCKSQHNVAQLLAVVNFRSVFTKESIEIVYKFLQTIFGVNITDISLSENHTNTLVKSNLT